MKFLVIAMCFVASVSLASTPAVRGVEVAKTMLPEKSVRLLVGEVGEIFSGNEVRVKVGEAFLYLHGDRFKHIDTKEQILADMIGEKFAFNNSSFVEVEMPEQRATVLVPQGMFDWIDKLGVEGTVGAEELHRQAMESILQLLNNDYEAFSLGGLVFLTEIKLFEHNKVVNKYKLKNKQQDQAQ